MRRSRIALIMMATILCLAVFFSCSTVARWQDQYSDTDDGADVSSVSANPSAPYIVYAALSSSGALISASDNGTTTAAYAVVGYTGLVAELEIPATYGGLPVTKAMGVSNYADYKCSRNGSAYTGDDARLANQTVVTSIVFGSNVARICEGVCNSMINLAFVRFSGSVALEDYAFLNCVSLATVSGTYTWATSTANGTAFYGCVFDPAGV